MDPLPLPLAPLVIVSHDALLDAVHVHADAGIVTDTVPWVPVAGTEALTGAIVAVQAIPACVTVNVWPPTVNVPVRLVMSGFAPTENATVPSPVPDAPDVIEIHDADDVAFQVQPVVVSTLSVLLVAVAGTEALTGEMENAQFGPDCVSVKVCPPAEIVPVRAVVPGLAATL
jgi:hypothetical protein